MPIPQPIALPSGADRHHLLLQVANSGAWGFALLDFKPEAILFELWLYNIMAPRSARLNIGLPGTISVHASDPLLQLHTSTLCVIAC